MADKSQQMTCRQAASFMRALAKNNPEPATELAYGNNYQLLVAVVLSAQATDKGVNAATEKLFKKVQRPAQMVKLGVAGLEKHIRTVGLYKTKAKNVIKLSELLLERHDGEIPASRKELEKLPGVGRKTANVILNCAFGEPTMAVDTHVFRVANRTGLAPGKTPLQVEEALLETVPADLLLHAHHWLILHGRYTCKARRPACAQCVARELCNYPDKEG